MLICDNCGKPAEQNHSKTEISSMRDNKGFEVKIDLCEECFDSFNYCIERYRYCLHKDEFKHQVRTLFEE